MDTIKLEGQWSMAAPKKYPDELRERAVRLTLEARKDPATAVGAIKRVADQLGSTPRRCAVGQARRDRRRSAARDHDHRGRPDRGAGA